MNKVLNVVDAVDGLIAVDDKTQLERVAKRYLQPIIGSPGEHIDGGLAYHRDPRVGTTMGDSAAAEGPADSPPSDNPWWSMTPDQKKEYAATRLRAKLAEKRAEGEPQQLPLSFPRDDE
jgi:hypothetical protein